MTRHIGIIGCSAEGASLCYRTICAEAHLRMGPHAHPEITMHTPSLAQYVSALKDGDMDRVADLMLSSARILERAGADLLICPDNTIHQAFGLFAKRSPLASLHIAEITAEQAARQGLQRLALLGTASLVRSDVYPTALAVHGIEAVRPASSVITEVDRIIFEELVPGLITPTARSAICQHITELADQGCDGVVLGCTEIPLLITQQDSSLPILDTTRLLARAALEHALSD